MHSLECAPTLRGLPLKWSWVLPILHYCQKPSIVESYSSASRPYFLGSLFGGFLSMLLIWGKGSGLSQKPSVSLPPNCASAVIEIRWCSVLRGSVEEKGHSKMNFNFRLSKSSQVSQLLVNWLTVASQSFYCYITYTFSKRFPHTKAS